MPLSDSNQSLRAPRSLLVPFPRFALQPDTRGTVSRNLPRASSPHLLRGAPGRPGDIRVHDFTVPIFGDRYIRGFSRRFSNLGVATVVFTERTLSSQCIERGLPLHHARLDCIQVICLERRDGEQEQDSDSETGKKRCHGEGREPVEEGLMTVDLRSRSPKKSFRARSTFTFTSTTAWT